MTAGPAKRSDIQALRALAVLVVIIFHLKEAWIPFGYLGVDIFFVISGFVISRGIIARSFAGTPFSATGFLWRRINRLLPALLFTLVLTTILGFLLYPAKGFADLAASATYALGGLSNIYFFTQTDYFAAPLDTMPALHTWSLSVEEQFYLVFALLMAFFTWIKIARSRWLILFWLITFVLSLWLYLNPSLVTDNVKAIERLGLDNAAASFQFFMLPTRFFQLALGIIGSYLLLFFDMQKVPIVVRQFIWSLATLGMIAVVLLAPHGTAIETVTLSVSVLAFLAMVFGEGTGIADKGILRAAVFVGDRSYSLYLVHWPAVVFATFYLFAYGEAVSIPVAALATVLLGEVSYRYFENIRNNQPKTAGAVPSGSSLMVYMILFFFMAQYFVGQNNGLPGRIASAATSDFYKYKRDFRRINRFPKGEKRLGRWASFFTIQPKKKRISKRVLVLGDSHGRHLQSMGQYYVSTKQQAWDFYLFTGCPPIFGHFKYYDVKQTKEHPKQAQCRAQVAQWEQYVTKNVNKYDVVILSSRWDLMFNDGEFGDFEFRKDALAKVGTTDIPTIEISRRNFIDGLRQTVTSITNSGAKVVIMGQPPLSSRPLEGCHKVPRFLFSEAMIGKRCNFDRYEDIVERARFVDEILRNPEAFDIPKSATVVATDIFCNAETRSCNRFFHGKPISDDTNHYNEFGALYLAKVLAQRKDIPLN